MSEFVSSPFSTEFEPLALVTDEFLNLSMALRRQGGGWKPEVFATETIPRFSLNLIDGIVITDFESRNDTINRLIKIGVEPRKIILWNNRGIIEPLTFKARCFYGRLAISYSQQ